MEMTSVVRNSEQPESDTSRNYFKVALAVLVIFSAAFIFYQKSESEKADKAERKRQAEWLESRAAMREWFMSKPSKHKHSTVTPIKKSETKEYILSDSTLCTIENSTIGKRLYHSRTTRYVLTGKESNWNGRWFEHHKTIKGSNWIHNATVKDWAHLHDPYYWNQYHDVARTRSVRLVEKNGVIYEILHHYGSKLFWLSAYHVDGKEVKGSEMACSVDTSGKVRFVSRWYGLDSDNPENAIVADSAQDKNQLALWWNEEQKLGNMKPNDPDYIHSFPVYTSTDYTVRRYQKIVDEIFLKLE